MQAVQAVQVVGAPTAHQDLDAVDDMAPASIKELENETWDSFAEAKAAVYSFVKTKGFAVSIKRSSNPDPETKEYRWYEFECAQGEKKPSQSLGKRSMKRVRNDCPYKCTLRYYKRSAKWRFVLDKDEHNHTRMEEPGMLAVMRKNDRIGHQAELQHVLKRYTENPRTTAWQSVADFKAMVPGNPIEMYEQDIRNLVYGAKRQERGPYSDTQLFLQKLEEDPEIFYKTKFSNGETGRLEYVFWTSQWAISQWRSNPEVMIFDNTYKTNRFNLPLTQLAGVTGSHTSFNMGWGLMFNETEDGFLWMFRQVRSIMQEHDIDDPFTIISDYDRAARNAIFAQFETEERTATQLCIWHIMKNVAFHVKRDWRGELGGTLLGQTLGGEGSRTSHERELHRLADGLLTQGDREARVRGEDIRSMRPIQIPANSSTSPNPQRTYQNDADGLLAAWKDCVYAETKEEFDRNWGTLRREFPDQQKIVNYISETYLGLQDQFAQYAIKKHRNYGIRVTSRVEGLHRLVKQELKSRNASLLILFQAVQRFMERQRSKYREVHNEDGFKMPDRADSNFLFALVLRRVSVKAVQLMQDQERIAKEAIRDGRNGTCTHQYSQQYGLPCWHLLQEKMRAKSPIEMHEVHVHWYNNRINDSAEELRRRQQDPAIRPRRSGIANEGRRHDTSTRRDLSHDELRQRRQPREVTTDTGYQGTSLQVSQGASTQPVTLPEPGRQMQGEAASLPYTQTIQRRAPTCNACGQAGHTRNSYLCPLKRV